MSQQVTRANAFGASDTAKTPGGLVEVKKEEATEVAAANPGRVSITLTNDSANKIYVYKGSGATIGKGIPLTKEGGVAVIDDYLGIITAAALTGTSNLCVCEV